MKLDSLSTKLLLPFFAAIAIGATSLGAYAQAALPPLPQEIKSQGELKVGVRCDQPPYGFKDNTGAFAGVEVEMARKIAAWAFGSTDKAQLTCVTAENRVPLLMGKKVDLLIATLGVTPERARVIDFSKAYRWGNSDLLVLKDSPIKTLDDIKDKTVIVLKGSTQAKWFETKMPQVTTLRLNTASDALQSLMDKRADAFSTDAATLVVIAAKNEALRRTNLVFSVNDAAVGLRKDEPEWKAYVQASLDRMKAEGLFIPWVKKWVPPEIQSYYIEVFTKPVPTGKD